MTLATVEEATSARESLDGSFQGGKSISVRPFQAEPPRRDGRGWAVLAPVRWPASAAARRAGPPARRIRTLYVGNLPYDATVEEVEGLIGASSAGPVVRVHLPMDPDGRKRGFGFVTMASADAAKGAIEALKGADIRGRRLVVNLAHPKGERPAGGDRPGGGYAGGGGGGGYAGGGGGGGGGGFSGGGGGGGSPAALLLRPRAGRRSTSVGVAATTTARAPRAQAQALAPVQARVPAAVAAATTRTGASPATIGTTTPESALPARSNAPGLASMGLRPKPRARFTVAPVLTALRRTGLCPRAVSSSLMTLAVDIGVNFVSFAPPACRGFRGSGPSGLF